MKTPEFHYNYYGFSEGNVHDPSMSFGMHHSPAMAEITHMLDTPGLEVFRNIPEMLPIATEIIDEISQHPGESVYVGIAGLPRIGKKHILGGLLHVVTHSTVLSEAMEEAGSNLEIWCAKSADGYREAKRRGDIPESTPWGHWSPQDSEWATYHLERGINWAMHHRTVGELGTRLVLFSGVGVLDPNPKNPLDRQTRYKSNIGGSVHQHAARHNFSRIIFPFGNEEVRDETHDFFAALEDVIDDPEQTAALLAHHNIELDEDTTARDLLRDGAGAFGMERVTMMYYRNMVSLGGEVLGTRSFSEEELRNDSELRAFVEKQYLQYLGEAWGYPPDRIHIVDNTHKIPPINDQGSRECKRYLGGLIKKHTIPLHLIPDITIPHA